MIEYNDRTYNTIEKSGVVGIAGGIVLILLGTLFIVAGSNLITVRNKFIS